MSNHWIDPNPNLSNPILKCQHFISSKSIINLQEIQHTKSLEFNGEKFIMPIIKLQMCRHKQKLQNE